MVAEVLNRWGEQKGKFDTEKKILYIPYCDISINNIEEFVFLYGKLSYSDNGTIKILTWEDVNNIVDWGNEKNFVRTITTESGVILNGYKFNERVIYYAYVPKNIANELTIDVPAFYASITKYDNNGVFIKCIPNKALHIKNYITRITFNLDEQVGGIGYCETLTLQISPIAYEYDMKSAYKIASSQDFRRVKNICVFEYIDEDGKICSKGKQSFINESYSFDFFKDCRTYQEKKEKVIDFLKRGLITASFASMLFSFIAPNKAAQEALEREVIETITGHKLGSENEDFKFGKFDDKTEFATEWKISEEGIKHIKNYEKFSSTPYYVTPYDKENNIRTIGYGHKIKSTDPIELQNTTSITKEEAEELFRSDIAKFERFFRIQIVPKLNKKLQDPETIPQALIDVIISMMYNAGNGNFRNENINPFYTRLKNCRYDNQTGKINKQDYDYTIAAIKTSLVLHNNEKLKGLENRRKTEYKIAASAK